MKDSISLGFSYNEKKVKSLLGLGLVIVVTFSGILITSIANKIK
ncbi:hypothetical protein [Clostridium sp.]|nr:hypothetical protein [Clostridium sp.]MDO5038519.1 hypothetical protein [Clostridium sp.]